MTVFEASAPMLPEIFALHGKWQPHKEAVICDDTRLSWAEFCAANHQFAHGLLSRGINEGDRVGVVMSNGLPMVQALYGTMAAGAVSVPINLSVSDDAIVSMFHDAQISVLVVTPDQRVRLDGIAAQLPQTLKLCIDTGDEVAQESADTHWLNLAQLCKGQPTTLPALALSADSPLNIIYSSGTTGLPKGILHTHRGRRDWAYDLAIALRYHSGARTLLTIGLYSNIVWVAMLATLLAGGTLVVHRKFDARVFLETTEREKITHTAMVPIQFQRVAEAQRDIHADVSSLQAMMSAGSPLHENLKRELFSLIPCGVIELYGLTEGIITTLDPEDANGRWSSVGRPLIGTDISIIDDKDQQVAPGVSGEIVSRGRITMPGYWQREDANQDAEYIDEAGVQWLRSGDIGYVDDEGFLYIVDRKKDMILSGGQNIYPQDIEAVLVEHVDIDDVAVIGAASVRWGETPVALVVLRGAAQTDKEAICTWANERLGKQQRLADVVLVDELPRNPNGKLLKRELRKTFGALLYD